MINNTPTGVRRGSNNEYKTNHYLTKIKYTETKNIDGNMIMMLIEVTQDPHNRSPKIVTSTRNQELIPRGVYYK